MSSVSAGSDVSAEASPSPSDQLHASIHKNFPWVKEFYDELTKLLGKTGPNLPKTQLLRLLAKFQEKLGNRVDRIHRASKQNLAKRAAVMIHFILINVKIAGTYCKFEEDQAKALKSLLSLLLSNYVDLNLIATFNSNTPPEEEEAYFIYRFVNYVLLDSPEAVLDVFLASKLCDNVQINSTLHINLLTHIVDNHKRFMETGSGNGIVKFLALLKLFDGQSELCDQKAKVKQIRKKTRSLVGQIKLTNEKFRCWFTNPSVDAIFDKIRLSKVVQVVKNDLKVASVVGASEPEIETVFPSYFVLDSALGEEDDLNPNLEENKVAMRSTSYFSAESRATDKFMDEIYSKFTFIPPDNSINVEVKQLPNILEMPHTVMVEAPYVFDRTETEKINYGLPVGVVENHNGIGGIEEEDDYEVVEDEDVVAALTMDEIVEGYDLQQVLPLHIPAPGLPALAHMDDSDEDDIQILKEIPADYGTDEDGENGFVRDEADSDPEEVAMHMEENSSGTDE